MREEEFPGNWELELERNVLTLDPQKYYHSSRYILRQCDEPGNYAGKELVESAGIGGEGRVRAKAEQAVRVVAGQVAAVGVQLGSLDQRDREVVGKVMAQDPVPEGPFKRKLTK